MSSDHSCSLQDCARLPGPAGAFLAVLGEQLQDCPGLRPACLLGHLGCGGGRAQAGQGLPALGALPVPTGRLWAPDTHVLRCSPAPAQSTWASPSQEGLSPWSLLFPGVLLTLCWAEEEGDPGLRVLHILLTCLAPVAARILLGEGRSWGKVVYADPHLAPSHALWDSETEGPDLSWASWLGGEGELQGTHRVRPAPPFLFARSARAGPSLHVCSVLCLLL